MKCIETFKTREKAQEACRTLRDSGIEARVMVDTMDGRYGGLQEFDDVGLMVDEASFYVAKDMLAGQSRKRAS